jgi:hypothetical protein
MALSVAANVWIRKRRAVKKYNDKLCDSMLLTPGLTIYLDPEWFPNHWPQ